MSKHQSNSDIKLSTNIQPPETVTIEQHTVFTTHRKKPKTSINICRKGSIVKERCKQLCTVIAELYPNRIISNQDLTCLLQDYIGADKETIRAYKGYSSHIRQGKYGDSQVVGLSRKGYLEVYGFLVKLPGKRWVLTQTVLSLSEEREAPLGYNMYSEGVSSGFQSIEKISISTKSGESKVGSVVFDGSCGKGWEGKPEVALSSKINNNNTSEKERNFSPKISPKISDERVLSPVELAVFSAKPAVEPDRAKTNFRETRI